MQPQAHCRAPNYERFRILAIYVFRKVAGSIRGSLLNEVIHYPEFLLHVFDDKLIFVSTYFLVFTSFMTVSTPQYLDQVSGRRVDMPLT